MYVTSTEQVRNDRCRKRQTPPLLFLSLMTHLAMNYGIWIFPHSFPSTFTSRSLPELFTSSSSPSSGQSTAVLLKSLLRDLSVTGPELKLQSTRALPTSVPNLLLRKAGRIGGRGQRVINRGETVLKEKQSFTDRRILCPQHSNNDTFSPANFLTSTRHQSLVIPFLSTSRFAGHFTARSRHSQSYYIIRLCELHSHPPPPTDRTAVY